MPDRILELGGSIIQHGEESDRIYALRLDPADMPDVLDDLEEMAVEEGYGKIVAKGRGSDFGEFAARDYQAEALVPRFFGPGEAGVFMGKFLDPERARPGDAGRIEEVLQVALDTAASTRRGPGSERAGAGPADPELDQGPVPGRDPETASDLDGLILRGADPDDASAIASCYDTVFESYPFPIQDPAHVREEMEGGTRFFTAWDGGKLVAASSMEPGGAHGTVEMTDFATLPGYRGRGLATRLLTIMDRVGRTSGLRVAYTIARARSYGMNITFARRGYRYGGTLTNNTQIAGAIESMNVWFKPLLL
jgi:putative beta-lysine N-acetyltransferase